MSWEDLTKEQRQSWIRIYRASKGQVYGDGGHKEVNDATYDLLCISPLTSKGLSMMPGKGLPNLIPTTLMPWTIHLVLLRNGDLMR